MDVQLGGEFTSTELRLMLLSLLCQSSGMDRNAVNEIHNEFQSCAAMHHDNHTVLRSAEIASIKQ